MDENTISEIYLNIDTSKNKISEIILLKILDIKRLALSFVLPAGFAVFLCFWGKGGEATAPLVIFLVLVSGLFLYLCIYSCWLRPRIMHQLQIESKYEGCAVFTQKDMRICFNDMDEVVIKYRDVKGQYWRDDSYFLFLDGKGYHSILGFAVSDETYDGICMLSSALERKKIKLVQITEKRRKKNEKGNT